MNSTGGLIGIIPDSKILDSKQNEEITTQAERITNFLKFSKIKNIVEVSKIKIFGTYNLKLQPYFADIDTRNEVDLNLTRKESIPFVTKMFQHIVEKIENKKGWFFTDAKAGIYKNGEAIHWTAEEIKKGYRDNRLDFNGNKSNGEKLKNAISQFYNPNGENVLLKIDMVVPYFGKYLEVTCVYDIKCLSDDRTEYVGFNLSEESSSFENITKTLIMDTEKQLLKHKYFKVMKRLYALSRYYKDTSTAQFLAPLLISNVSKMSSVESDLKTLELLIFLDKPINKNLVFGQLNKSKEILSNILDIDFSMIEVDKQFDLLYEAIRNDDKNESLNILSMLTEYFHNIVNIQVQEYLKFYENNIPKNNYINNIFNDVVGGDIIFNSNRIKKVTINYDNRNNKHEKNKVEIPEIPEISEIPNFNIPQPPPIPNLNIPNLNNKEIEYKPINIIYPKEKRIIEQPKLSQREQMFNELRDKLNLKSKENELKAKENIINNSLDKVTINPIFTPNL